MILIRYRQYGLWERYSDLFPNRDLVYTVGVSDYRTDWFFAQVTRFFSFFFYVSLNGQIDGFGPFTILKFKVQ